MNRQVASIGLCMLISVAVRVSGQDSTFVYQTDGNSFTSNVYLNDLPSKAFRHFRKSYPDVTHEQWMKTGRGYSAYYGTQDSIFCHVLYDRSGHFEKALTYYAPGMIPKPLKESMRNACPEYTVLYTSEMDEGLKKTYEVLLADDASVKVIDVSDEDIRTVYEYRLGSTARIASTRGAAGKLR